MARRGIIAHDAQRKPGARLTPASAAEVDRLMARLDRRLAELGA